MWLQGSWLKETSQVIVLFWLGAESSGGEGKCFQILSYKPGKCTQCPLGGDRGAVGMPLTVVDDVGPGLNQSLPI